MIIFVQACILFNPLQSGELCCFPVQKCVRIITPITRYCHAGDLHSSGRKNYAHVLLFCLFLFRFVPALFAKSIAQNGAYVINSQENTSLVFVFDRGEVNGSKEAKKV